MSIPGEAAERFVIERGVHAQSSLVRQRTLGCIACCWDRKVAADEYPEYTNSEIAFCLTAAQSSIHHLSTTLVEAGLVTSRTLELGFGKQADARTLYYSPVDKTPEGIAFQDSLEAPADCPQAQEV